MKLSPMTSHTCHEIQNSNITYKLSTPVRPFSCKHDIILDQLTERHYNAYLC